MIIPVPTIISLPPSLQVPRRRRFSRFFIQPPPPQPCGFEIRLLDLRPGNHEKSAPRRRCGRFFVLGFIRESVSECRRGGTTGLGHREGRAANGGAGGKTGVNAECRRGRKGTTRLGHREGRTSICGREHGDWSEQGGCDWNVIGDLLQSVVYGLRTVGDVLCRRVRRGLLLYVVVSSCTRTSRRDIFSHSTTGARGGLLLQSGRRGLFAENAAVVIASRRGRIAIATSNECRSDNGRFVSFSKSRNIQRVVQKRLCTMYVVND